MSDRDLLERAAKAAGIALERSKRGLLLLQSLSKDKRMGCIWNPLADDGDAFRLAVKLRLLVNVDKSFCHATNGDVGAEEIYKGGDPYAATRRAIVRAAAAMAGDAL